MSFENRIFRTNKLTEEYIDGLINDKFLALIIENYYPSSQCDSLSKKIITSEQVQNYTHEMHDGKELVQKYFGVDRLGFPFNLTYNADPDSEIISRYYKEAILGRELLRSFCSPCATPIDKLRLELDEQFISGATIAKFENKKMLAGIGRITKANLSHLSADEPHFDALPSRYANLDSQLAANIYLKVPNSGGELEVWDVAPVDPLTSVPLKWRASLPPSQKIKPQKGDLVLFNCRRPHAICSFTGEDRVTVQLFIGYQKNKPLQLWN